MEQLFNSLSEFSTVNRKNLDELVGLVEELVINKVRIERIKNEFSNNSHAKILDQELRIISDIQESIKKVRLIKLKTISNSITSLVDQCCSEYSINADFIFDGQETQIENSLINYVHNVFAYFIKDIYKNEFIVSENSSNKIRISAYSDDKNLTAIIESNGKGFDFDAICKALSTESLELLALSEEQIRTLSSLTGSLLNLEDLFKLKSDLQSLDGSLKLEAKLNEFRRITIVIPLSSSIMQGLLVTISNQVYAIPLEFIETIINSNTMEIKKSNNTEVIMYMDHVIRLIRVSQLLNLETKEDSSCLLIVNANNKKAALLVDSLLDQTDMVIKHNHPMMKDIREIKGTTILGDGLVTLVLDIPSILKEI
jgi:Chemotaxis protein histidine kinase and related kinases